jgi:micrococcal nuclease
MPKKFKNLIISSTVILITACISQVLPNKNADLTNYIPNSTQNSQNFTNYQHSNSTNINFPTDCQWHKYNRHVDGDTIIVDKNTRVRFLGIDTPETKKPNTPIQPFGLAASNFTKNNLKNSKKVCLIFSNIGNTQDKYGRKLAYIFTESGFDLNAELLKHGLAKVYTKASFDRKQEFIKYENFAKSQKINLWQ